MKLKYLLPVFAALCAPAAHAAATAPSFFAVVDSNGTLSRGYRAVSATHLGAGKYSVAFARDVTQCGYTASVGLSGTAGSEAHGTVNVSPRPDHVKAIFVQTFTPDGTRTDLGFHVIVAC